MNFRRSMFAAFCVASLCLTSACSKKIDGSSEDKFYQSVSEVSKTLPSDRQDEFNNGIEMILFFAPDKTAEYAEMNGKNADEIFAMIEKLKAEKSRIDASRREKFESSVNEVLKSYPGETARKQLKVEMERYGFYPWSAKNVQSINGLNAFEVRQTINDIKRNEDPTTASQPQTQRKK